MTTDGGTLGDIAAGSGLLFLTLALVGLAAYALNNVLRLIMAPDESDDTIREYHVDGLAWLGDQDDTEVGYARS